MQAATSVAGKGQKAPYIQGNIDLTDKKEVEEADRKRFSFVNEIVSKVEVRKTLTKEKSKDDAIDIIVTHPVWGLITLSLIHISEPTRLGMISYAVFCLKKNTHHLPPPPP